MLGQNIRTRLGIMTNKESKLSIKSLVEAGAHFGHQTDRWNPKMAPYIYGVRNKTHIIDLSKTLYLYNQAADFIKKRAEEGYQFLFVGTKRQAQEAIENAAVKSKSFYVNHRWLGGLLTNFKTVQNSLRSITEAEKTLENPSKMLTKKELGLIKKNLVKKLRDLGGIRNLRKVTKMVIIVSDTNVESKAICEARSLGFPIVGIVDTNSDPDIDFPIPANDDASKSIDSIISALGEVIADVKGKKTAVTQTADTGPAGIDR